MEDNYLIWRAFQKIVTEWFVRMCNKVRGWEMNRQNTWLTRAEVSCHPAAILTGLRMRLSTVRRAAAEGKKFSQLWKAMDQAVDMPANCSQEVIAFRGDDYRDSSQCVIFCTSSAHVSVEMRAKYSKLPMHSGGYIRFIVDPQWQIHLLAHGIMTVIVCLRCQLNMSSRKYSAIGP
jgi:hypothetical protein